MDIISSTADKSSLQFRFMPSEQLDLQTIWFNLYAECEQENKKIDCKRMSVSKEKEKIRNIVHMVKVFHSVVSDRSIDNCNSAVPTTDAVICEDASTEGGIGNKVGESKNNDNLRTQQNEIKQNSIIFAEGDRNLIDEERSVQLQMTSQISAKGDFVSVENDRSIHQQTLHIKESRLQLKLQKQLMKICKEIPAYDANLHVCRNSEIFESHADRFELSNEHRNRLFRLWLPVNFSRSLAMKQADDNDSNEWLSYSDIQRLKELIWCTRSDSMPTYEILKELKIGRKESTFGFMSMFERTYKAVIENAKPSHLIRMFVKKFSFLEPSMLVLASEKQSLFQAAKFLEIMRKHMSPSHIRSVERTQADTKIDRTRPKKNLKDSKKSKDSLYEQRRHLHVMFKPYNKMSSAIETNPPIINEHISQCQQSKDSPTQVKDLQSEQSQISKGDISLQIKCKDIQNKMSSKYDYSDIIEEKFKEKSMDFLNNLRDIDISKSVTLSRIFQDLINRNFERIGLHIG